MTNPTRRAAEAERLVLRKDAFLTEAAAERERFRRALETTQVAHAALRLEAEKWKGLEGLAAARVRALEAALWTPIGVCRGCGLDPETERWRESRGEPPHAAGCWVAAALGPAGGA